MSLKSKFCASCGKETDKLVDGMCAACLLKHNPVSVPNKISLRICPKCGAVFWRGLWLHSKKPIDYYLKALLLQKIKVKPPAEIEDLIIEETGKQGRITLVLEIGDKIINHTENLFIELQKFACPPCSREKKQSYQAIIQLRSSKDPNKLISNASKTIQKYSPYIVQVKDQARGVDIYLSDKELAMNMSKSLKRKFDLSMGTSSKAYGWDRLKDKPHFRITIILKE